MPNVNNETGDDFSTALQLLELAQTRMLLSNPSPYGTTWQLCYKISRFRNRFACPKCVVANTAPN